MKKIICRDDFWEMFPDCKIGIVVCKGIDNVYKENEAEYEALIREGEKRALTFLTEENFTDNKVIKVWREAYMKFKTKKGARCSIEALMKRISKENHLGTINPIVDIYNSVSLSHAMPCGGEDIDCMEGDLLLTKADGDEPFQVIGSDQERAAVSGGAGLQGQGRRRLQMLDLAGSGTYHADREDQKRHALLRAGRHGPL